MVAYNSVYDSLADLMATMDAEKVLAFHAPASFQERRDKFLKKKQTGEISERESEELASYYILEHTVRLAKSSGRLHLCKNQA